MNRINGRQIDELVEGMDRDKAFLAEETLMTINRTEENIETKSEQIERELSDLRTRIAKGQNTYTGAGWLARMGAEIDVEVATRNHAWSTLGFLIGRDKAGALAQRNVPEDERV